MSKDTNDTGGTVKGAKSSKCDTYAISADRTDRLKKACGTDYPTKIEGWRTSEDKTTADWTLAIMNKLANKDNPLAGVISDEAYREMMRVQAQAVQRVARVVIADLDGADGKFDGIIHKETVQRKAVVLAKTFGFSQEDIDARIKEMPPTLSTDELNAGVAKVVKYLSDPTPKLQQGLPRQKPTEQSVIRQN